LSLPQPRKFKIAIAVPPSNDVDVLCHDLGYIAIVDENKQLLGFNVSIGGGMGVTQCVLVVVLYYVHLTDATPPPAPSRPPTLVSPTSSDSSPPSRDSRSPWPS
jgi:hypothetical protein